MQLSDVKTYMASKQHVTYDGNEYYISAVTMRIFRGKWLYELELHDLNAKSVTVIDIDKLADTALAEPLTRV